MVLLTFDLFKPITYDSQLITMARSTKLDRLITDPLNTRLTTAEAKVATIETRGLVELGDNISELNNDAQYQTLSQVNAIADTKINALIDSAPGTLNTLGEIATALADDDSAVAAIVAVNTAQNAAIEAIEAVNTTQSAAIAQHDEGIANLQTNVQDTDGDTYIDYEVGTTDNDQIDFYTGGQKTGTFSQGNLNIAPLGTPFEDYHFTGMGEISFEEDISLKAHVGDTPKFTIEINGGSVLTVGSGFYLNTGLGDDIASEIDSIYTNTAMCGINEGSSDGKLVTHRLIKIKATEATYDNTVSGLSAVNTQAAIDALAVKIETLFFRTGIQRRTINSDTVLTPTDKKTQNIINSGSTVLNVVFPTTPPVDTDFVIINHLTSGANIVANGNIIAPGEQYAAQYDGVEWIEN